METAIKESTELPLACAVADRRDRRRIRRSIMILALSLLAPFVLAVSATYTDSEVNDGNTFTSGTVDLGVTPASALVTMANMAPGDAFTRSVEVANSGNMELRYAITSTTTENPLAAQLVLTVRSGITPANCTTANIGTGSPVYSGILGTTTGTNIAGDPTAGDDTGDRTINGSSNEALCFSVSLPVGVTSAAASTTTATFAFVAEQTANNP
jgi:hypothetical protein